jgi:hypothetical protein
MCEDIRAGKIELGNKRTWRKNIQGKKVTETRTGT